MAVSIPSPENQILVCLAQRFINSGEDGKLRELLSQPVNWDSLLQEAHHHCLFPLLAEHLTGDLSGLSESVRAQLQKDRQEQTRLNLLLTGEMLKVIAALTAESIKALTFKGPTLALSAYGNPGLRQFADIDILVPETEIARASSRLSKLGFTPIDTLTSGQRAAWTRFDCAQNFENPNGAVVDLHWRLFERCRAVRFDSEQLWNRRVWVKVGSHDVPTLSTEDLLLVLCVHGFTHSWDRLGWICDVAGLVTRQRIDWETVTQRATSWGVHRILSLGLLLAYEIVGAPLPAEVVRMILEDSVAKKYAGAVRENLFAPREESAASTGVGLHLGMREQWSDKVGSLIRFAIMPRSYDLMYASAPASLPSLYYLIRPIRMAGQYTSKLFRQRPES